MWFLYAFTGAFFKSLSGLFRKGASSVPSTVFAWLNSCFYILILLPFVLYLRLPVFTLIQEHFWLSLALASSTMFGFIFNVKALSKAELSFVAPLNGIMPVITLLGAWLFLGELPSALGVACIVLIFLGTYVMTLSAERVHWYDPIKYLVNSSAARLSFASVVLYALSTVFIKQASNLEYHPLTIIFVTDLLGIFILSYIFFTKQRRAIIPAIREKPREILLSSLTSLLGSILHNLAVAATFASYALAIRRLDGVFSVLLGWHFLKESNIKNKLIGATIITLGSAVLALIS